MFLPKPNVALFGDGAVALEADAMTEIHTAFVSEIPCESEDRKARAIADCKSDNGMVLDFSKGDIFHNVQPATDGWVKGSLNGKNGLIPEHMLQML